MDYEKHLYFLGLLSVFALIYFIKRKTEIKRKNSTALHGKHKLEKKDWTGIDD